MSTVLDQVDALTAQAVELLLAERERIDQRLAQLGDKKSPDMKRRGRPPKVMQTSPPDTIPGASPSAP